MSIVFELCRNPQLLKQYYRLREECFRKDLNIPDFDGSEEYRDRKGHILLAHKDGQCIGGSRISPCKPVSRNILDLEVDWDYACLWERAFLAPEARSPAFAMEFGQQLAVHSYQLGYHKAIVLSSLRNARYYRRVNKALGIPFDIFRHAPECAEGKFAGLEHYLSVAHLQDAQSEVITRAA